MPGFQLFFRFLHHFVLAKLAISSIRVNQTSCSLSIQAKDNVLSLFTILIIKIKQIPMWLEIHTFPFLHFRLFKLHLYEDKST